MPHPASPPELPFPFTERDTPALRRRIQGDLALVTERARSADPAYRALVLTGGFSRGEGTARADAPVNDYDMVVVRDLPGEGPYPQLHHELSQELGIEVDLLPIWGWRLPRVGRKLFWLDARLGARVIDGDPRALSGMRRFDQVDPGEVPRLLGNRAAGLLLALPGAGEAPDAAQRDLQATKAVLAAMDAALLHAGHYAPTMRERLHLSRDHADHAVFARAVEWKLRGTVDAPVWEAARDVLLRAVDATASWPYADGALAHVLHAVKARRITASPSQAVRRRAWSLLKRCSWPDGPPAWREEKSAFFAARALTLQ